VHIIIVGAGKVGYNLAQMLSNSNHDVVVIEKNEERRSILSESLDIQTVAGNGASFQSLEEAGIREADMLIAVTESDETNLISCLIGKQFGVKQTVARVRNPEYADYRQGSMYTKMGIDLVINPELVTAREIAKLIEVPEALSVDYYADGRIQLLELKIEKNSPVAGKKLQDINIPGQFLIVSILRKDKMIVPGGEDTLNPGDLVFIFALAKESGVIEKFLGKRINHNKNIFLLGAGRISYYLADYLLRKKIASVKIIEKDKEAAKAISQKMPEALIINGDAADPDLLAEENVEEADIFAGVTDDDKINLLVCLLAKNLGAKKTIAQIRRSDYAALMEHVGIDVAVSPRRLMAEAILRFINKENIVSVRFLGHDKAEVLEIIVPSSFRQSQPLKKLRLPHGILIGAVKRKDKVFIPRGSDSILPGDQVMVFALPQNLPAVEQFFKVGGK